MPITQGAYAEYERQIFYKLINAGLPTASACGILANIQAESGFNPTNLQDSYERQLGFDDATYTAGVDTGGYTDFISDSAGYGLCQWTFYTRKAALLDYATKKKKSIGDLDTQVSFMISELQSISAPIGSLWTILTSVADTADNAYQMADQICRNYLKPANTANAAKVRAEAAKEKYWPHYSTTGDSVIPVQLLGNYIVEVARKNLGMPYELGGSSPSGFDDSGLVYYCYKQAGKVLKDVSTKELYDYCLTLTTTKRIDINDITPSDLLFFKDTDGNYIVSIATSKSTHIVVNADYAPVVAELSFSNPYSILRVLSDNQVIAPDTPSTDTGGSNSSPNFQSVVIVDSYSSLADTNLSRVSTNDYEYAYLFDISHSEGGSFRFYRPIFSEAAGANWSNIEIRGRSVNLTAYEYTNSRSITVNLDLYAGSGIYEGKPGDSLESSVDKLHKDLNFVKSLEYPDYTDPIVRPPATVHLVLDASINIIGVVSNVTVEHLKPLDKYQRSAYVKLSFTVTQTAVSPPDYKDIRSGTFTSPSTENVDSVYSGGATPSKSTSAPIFAGG